MDILMENLYIISLGFFVFSLIAFYYYSKAHPPKSIFQKPTKHVEIRTWRIK
ncbi:MAG: hypothetical protein K0Q87_4465 [Neobacillus sp.]|jgi:hypothetical protein|nr:hypothetical protein [Neobacillus sp.]